MESTIEPEKENQFSQLANYSTTQATMNKSIDEDFNEVGRDESLAKVEIATLSLILILAVLGNGLMLIALRKIVEYRPMSRMYFFMLNLSIADLFVAFGNILPQLAWDITFRFRGPDMLCRIVKFLQVFVLYLSTFILTSMTFDRYLVVCHHNFSHNYYGLKGPKLMVFMSYVISFILASPQAFIFSLKQIKESPGGKDVDCWATFPEESIWGAKTYVTFFVVFAFGLPLLIIGFSYGAICLKVVRYRLPQEPKKNPKTKGKPSMSSTSDIQRCEGEFELTVPETLNSKVSPQRNALQNQISQAKVKTLKLTLVVVFAFFLCWAPFCTTQIVVTYSSHNVGPIQVIILLLASLNSCTNPWIYLAFSESLRNQLRLYFGLGLRRGSDEESIGDEAKEVKVNRRAQMEGLELPKMNQIRKVPVHTYVGKDSPPSDNCDPKPETKSDIL